MKSKLYSVRDQKVNVFADPFPSPTDGAALRGMQSAVESGQGDISKYPEDFDLYCVAEFDPETGTVNPYPQPKHLSSALSFKKLDTGGSVAEPLRARQ